MGDRRDVHAAFLPIELKPGLATFSHGFELPSDCEMPIRLLKCTVFDRIGCQLVQDHRKCLDCAGPQRNTFGSVECDGSILTTRMDCAESSVSISSSKVTRSSSFIRKRSPCTRPRASIRS